MSKIYKDTSLMLTGVLVFCLCMFMAIRNAVEQQKQTLTDYGRKSHAAGIPATANPFKNTEGKWWLDGWIEAQEKEATK